MLSDDKQQFTEQCDIVWGEVMPASGAVSNISQPEPKSKFPSKVPLRYF